MTRALGASRLLLERSIGIMTKIAVLGGGNGAHAAAADLTLRGFTINMYEDERFAPNMQ